ncbi:hypothetical protein C8R44DRAFT_731323 [Mycena epipterygia]|nr:hypothetical protein C8R44DRAFT_751348 [Mycena epipterygia]KAJ7131055.1 hypothetical protein C8R44DRAFT_731323 [Mycena epipterygia]
MATNAMKGRLKGRICTCPLRKASHRVERDNEDAHRQELENFLRHPLATEMRELSERAVHLSISDPHPEPPAPHNVLAEAEKSVRALLSEALTDCPKQPTRQAQSNEVLANLSSKIQTAIASLQSANRALEDTNSLWEKVDHAKHELATVASSLKRFKDAPEKASIVDGMRKLESELKEFTATLPKDTRPLFYDSAYALENPIQHLDLMAQIMILLGLVCNVILGIAIGDTNFIFGTVTILIKLAMSVHAKPNTDGSYSYDALQEEILKDLPTSVYTAMNRLNLDGKTVLNVKMRSSEQMVDPDARPPC